ncbi:hypothetical protein EVAR_54492_1 [Eumeta japonica]|uniref:Uncharacterized protein n=1 Tax=Eumeta variegata TaxID=151549 RepID=A0A4C1YL89_EUMVA|nr:hypothetical protein EVAR_54492_1 [Eumeta japonica]
MWLSRLQHKNGMYRTRDTDVRLKNVSCDNFHTALRGPGGVESLVRAGGREGPARRPRLWDHRSNVWIRAVLADRQCTAEHDQIKSNQKYLYFVGNENTLEMRH